MRLPWWVPSVAGFLLVLAAFSPALRDGFAQDDTDIVKRNPIVARGDVLQIFSSPYWAGTSAPDRTLYRPLTILSFAVERRLVGDPRPGVSHAVNLLLHAAVGVLLFMWARRMGTGALAAAIASGVFLVHPVHTSVVANLVGRAESLCALFSLAALLCMGAAPGGKPGGASSRARFAGLARLAPWAAAACLFLALSSKETAVATLPLMIFQAILLGPGARAVRRSRWVDRIAPLAPSLLACFLYLVLRTQAILDFPGIQTVRPMDNPLVGLGGEARVATVLAMAARYAALLFRPSPLCPDYSGDALPREASLAALAPLAGAAWLLLLTALALSPLLFRLNALRRGKAGGTGEAWRHVALMALVFLVPYSVVGNLVVPSGAGFAERLLYLPSAGFCLLLGVAVERFLDALRSSFSPLSRGLRVAALTGLATIIVAGALDCRAQSRAWRDDESLFRSAAARCHRSARGCFVLGQMYERQGRTPEALQAFDDAIASFPEHFASWDEKGRLLGQQGDLDRAEAALRESIRIHPMGGDSHMWLGIVLSRRGRLDAAERELRKSLLLDPTLLKAAAQLGHLLFDSGRFEAAAKLYRKCVDGGRADLLPNLREAERRAIDVQH